MPRISRQSGPGIISNRLSTRRGRSSSSELPLVISLLGGVFGIIAAAIVVMLWQTIFSEVDFSSSSSSSVPQTTVRKKRHLPKSFGNVHNAIARDIIKSLDCQSLNLNFTEPSSKMVSRRHRRRRLADADFEIPDQGDNDAEQQENGDIPGADSSNWMQGAGDDDFGNTPHFDYNAPIPDGRYLMCLAAGEEQITKVLEKKNKDNEILKCNVDGLTKIREELLNVWSSARANSIPLDIIKKSLESVQETSKMIANHEFDSVWVTPYDDSIDYITQVLNEENSQVKYLDKHLGPGKLFVDVGSGLGFSTLAISFLYPGTNIISIEPAGPSWLLQRINMVCNLLPLSNDASGGSSSSSGSSSIKHKLPISMLSGIGPDNKGTTGAIMGKMMWRPSSVGTTRAWTPIVEKKDEDVELVVRLRTLRSILAEAMNEINDQQLLTASSTKGGNKILPNVLNIDCEGCEYNLVPALSQEEFDSIDIVIGTTGLHWGYIPPDKLPSTKRGTNTHERLCQHLSYAKSSIECCPFGDLSVRHPSPDSEEIKTISQILEENNDNNICENFKSWSNEKNLYTSTDDYGWSEMSSMSGGE